MLALCVALALGAAVAKVKVPGGPDTAVAVQVSAEAAPLLCAGLIGYRAFAMAQREIALAIGEPPATKGYPPSCFAKLPQLVERSGNGLNGVGSITAFYTVLSEGDDQQDPIADSARAILDGHIVLNRVLAEAGHYPAIDIEQSISRAMHNITDETHQKRTRRLKQLMSGYQRNRDLINVGAYSPGSDPLIDEAIRMHERIEHFLQQSIHERAGMEQSWRELSALFA